MESTLTFPTINARLRFYKHTLVRSFSMGNVYVTPVAYAVPRYTMDHRDSALWKNIKDKLYPDGLIRGKEGEKKRQQLAEIDAEYAKELQKVSYRMSIVCSLHARSLVRTKCVQL